MTTKKQLARLFRDVLKHNPDWVQVKPYAIWIRPIRHCIAQIYIYRGRSADVFWPRFSIAPLYWSGANWDWNVGSFSEGFRREPLPAPFTWDYFLQPDYERRPEFPQLAAWAATVGDFAWADPEIGRIFTRAVEEQVLPLLRPMALDHHAYLDFYRSHIIPRGNVHDEQRMAIALAEGALDEAREFLGQIWRWYESDTYGDYEPPEILDYPKRGARTQRAIEAWEKAGRCTDYRRRRRRILEIVEPLRTGDRAAIAAILHRWEAEAARFHQAERWWEPTPFPIEEGLA
ncbi:DUF615 domain-containing protein [Methylobacterium sp. E-041]|jgi:hypothetical protein|uniref:DUF615 domain-containing protein n=1 Tax=Methylobacterium sp. E-041 TaxID=2836573 RepID=UPI001FBBDA2E|nr:DUF615 domain-containing protein [Methylobacterium sp. E-041]MCJ2103884.1 DUF615 domain-containing protein [Methylobacterium sp. E-041]